MRKEKIDWLIGGMIIALVAIIDTFQALLLLVLIGFVLNWIITGAMLLSFSLYLAVKGHFSVLKGLTMGGVFAGSLVPFSTTTYVAITIAKIIAEQKLSKLGPAASAIGGLAKKL